jgi:hypothetical protein
MLFVTGEALHQPQSLSLACTLAVTADPRFPARGRKIRVLGVPSGLSGHQYGLRRETGTAPIL